MFEKSSNAEFITLMPKKMEARNIKNLCLVSLLGSGANSLSEEDSLSRNKKWQ